MNRLTPPPSTLKEIESFSHVRRRIVIITFVKSVRVHNPFMDAYFSIRVDNVTIPFGCGLQWMETIRNNIVGTLYSNILSL